jgi:hypothetical protein
VTERIHVDQVPLELASVSGDGMRLEICAPDGYGGIGESVACFRADDEGAVKFVVYTQRGELSFPLSELERAIEIARAEVHCESFYDDPSAST